MKTRLFLLSFFFAASPFILFAQNVGVDIASPQQKLDVLGGIRIGNTTTGLAGSIRWTGTQFEGHDGLVWAPFGSSSGTAWSLTGNSGTIPATNFIGTTDNVDFRIRTNNTDKVTINAAGNVGVGTTSPNDKMEVLGTIRVTNPGNSPIGSMIRLNSPANDIGIIMDRGDGSGTSQQRWDMKITSDNALRFRSQNTTDYFSFTNVGNMGIGTTAPAQALHVYRNGADAIIRVESPGSANEARIEFWKFGTLNAGVGFYPGTSDIRLRTGQSSGVIFEPNSIEKMRLTVAGNLGIGTTTPSDVLHVVGNIRMVDGNQANGFIPVSNANGTMTWTNPSTVIGSQAWKLTGNSGTVPATNFIGTTDNVDFRLRTNNTERVTINAAGNVGIGTTNPQSTMQVQANATGLNIPLHVKNTQGPDAGGTATGIGFSNESNATVGAKSAIVHERNTNWGRGDLHFLMASGANNNALALTDAKMTLTHGGNLGIGTISPVYKLDVNGSVYTAGDYSIINGGGTGTIPFRIDGNADKLYVIAESGAGGSNGTEIRFRTASAATQAADRVTIDKNGNMGIGVTGPLSYLDITGTNAGTTSLLLRSGNASNTSTSNQITFAHNGTANLRSAIKTRHHASQDAGNAIDFFVWDFGTDASGDVGTKQVMTIDGNGTGSVGIGTSTPAEELHVVGNIRMVDGNQAANRVLRSDANGTATWVDPNTVGITLDKIRDADNDTKIQTEESADEDKIRFDLAGTERFVMDGPRLYVKNSSSGVFIGDEAGMNYTAGTDNNTFVGYQAGKATTTGEGNTALGSGALKASTIAGFNTAIGWASMEEGITANNSTAVGHWSLQSNVDGANNIAIGSHTLRENVNGSGNIAVGLSAGQNNLGSGNIFLGHNSGQNETGSNKLYIDNTNTTAPLIYGDLNTNIINVNGNLGINTATPGQRLDVNGDARIQNGTVNVWALNSTEGGQVNLADGNNDADGQTNAWSLDVSINDFRIMDDGLVRAFFQDDGNLGIGTTIPAEKLDVNGKIKTTNFQMTNGAGANRVLQSDATGSASWVNVSSLTVTEVDPQVSSATTNYIPKWNGTTLVDGVGFDNGTNIGIGTTNPQDKLHVVGNARIDNGRLDFRNTGSSVFVGTDAGLNDDHSNNINVFVGNQAGMANTTGADNTAVGTGALKANTVASFNTAIGWEAMAAGVTADNSTAVGHWSLHSNVDGNSNVAIGSHALRDNVNGDNNTAIGLSAGQGNLGSGNIFIGRSAGQSETGDNKLYIDNSSTTTPLIYGDLNTNIININGNLGINTTAPGQRLDVNGDARIQSGTVNVWAATATEGGQINLADGNIDADGQTNAWSLDVSNNDFRIMDDGLVRAFFQDDGNLGINTTTPAEKLDINGKIRMRTGATTGYVPVSDANGTMTWTNPTSLTVTETDPQVSSATTNYIPKWNGTTLVDGVVYDNGTNVGIGTSSPNTPLTVGPALINGLNPEMSVNTTGNKPLFIGETTGTTGVMIGYNGNDIQGRTGANFVTNGDLLLNRFGGNVGVGTTSAAEKLDVNGKTKTTNFQMTNGAGTGRVLQSDASGNASWVNVTTLTVNKLVDADNDTKVQVEKNPDEDIIRFDVAGTEIFSMKKQGTNSQYLDVNSSNTIMGGGVSAGISGSYNSAYGFQSAMSLTSGQKNSYFGDNAGGMNTTGSNNTMVGTVAGQFSNGGSANTILGGYAGRNNAAGSNNTLVGFSAGENSTGSNNVFIGYNSGQSETGNNKLYVDNSGTSSPLIYGDFATDLLKINGTLNINNAYTLPTVAGTNGFVLQTDGAGAATWVNPTTLTVTETDPQVSSTTSNYIPKWNGTTLVDGLAYDNGTNIGVGTTAPSEIFHISKNGFDNYLRIDAGGPSANYSGIKLFEPGFDYGWYMRVDANTDDMYFAHSNGGTITDRVTFLDGGNVGIGTTLPAEKLDVVGNIKLNTGDSPDKLQLTNQGTAGSKIGHSTNWAVDYYAGPGNQNQRGYHRFFTTDNLAYTERMRIDNVGNVGIGTTAPGQLLDVNGKIQMRAGATAGYVPVSDASGTMTWTNPTSLSITETDPKVSSATNNQVPKWNGTTLTDGIITDNATNVGIGSATPAAKLDVIGTARATDVMANGTTGNLMLSNSNTSATDYFRIDGNADKLYVIAESGSAGSATGTEIRFRTAQTNATASDKVTINNNGNVGIGTIAPVNKLDVEGGLAVGVTYSGANSAPANGAIIEGNVGIGTSAPSEILHVYRNTSDAIIKVESPGGLYDARMVFQKNGSNTASVGFFPGTAELRLRTGQATGVLFEPNGVERMRVNFDGNVGIATINPADKLHVVGNIRMVDGNQAVNKVMVSDVNGTASWTDATSLTITETDPQVSSTTANYVPKWDGTTLIDANIYDNGTNIGIGTNVPTSKLHVVGANNIITEIESSSATGTWLRMRNSNSAVHWNWITTGTSNSEGPGKLLLRSSAGGFVQMTIQSDGNLGLGITSPASTLDINGNNGGSSSLLLRSGNTSAGTTSNQVTFGYNGTADYRSAIKTRHSSGGDAGNAIDFYVWDQGTDAQGAVGTKRVLTIDGNGITGGVGIGTSAPATPLHVVGNIRMVDGNQAANKVMVSDANGTGTWTDATTLTVNETDPQVSSASSNYVPKWNGTTLTDGSIYDNGNVGIGASTFATGEKLAVSNGTLQLGVYPGYLDNVANNNWATLDMAGTKGLRVWDNFSVSGTVGIGTSVPGGMLEVRKDQAGAVTQMIITNRGTTSAGTGSAIAFRGYRDIDPNYEVGKIEMQHKGGGVGDLTQAADMLFYTRGNSYGASTPDERMRITSEGNVGIGSTSPTSLLEIQGAANALAVVTIDQQGTDQYTGTNIQRDGAEKWFAGMNGTDNDFIIRGNATTDYVTINNADGNVGIGSTAPAFDLDIRKNEAAVNLELYSEDGTNGIGQMLVGASGGGHVNLIANTSTGSYLGIPASLSGVSTNFTDMVFATGTGGSASEQMRITTGGLVGIGIINPTQGKLVVNGTGTANGPAAFAYYARSGTSTSTGYNTTAVNDYSIYASNRVAASEFNAFSDERIKNIKGVSNGNNDLQTLMGIEVTDYTMKDSVAKGNKPYKKVIAQQVEKVYPQAVSTVTDVVPDIYKMAAISEGKITIANNLKAGEKVKLIFEDRTELTEVLEADATGFRVNMPDNGQVFVFGREVSDFHTVDYEALSMLNISATQELVKMMNQLKNENIEMKNKFSSLSSDVEMLKALLNTSTKAEK